MNLRTPGTQTRGFFSESDCKFHDLKSPIASMNNGQLCISIFVENLAHIKAYSPSLGADKTIQNYRWVRISCAQMDFPSRLCSSISPFRHEDSFNRGGKNWELGEKRINLLLRRVEVETKTIILCHGI